MRSLAFCIGFGFLAAACSANAATGADLQSPDAALGAQAPASGHNVSISVAVHGRGPLGDSVTVHIHNDGPDTAYLPRCGSGPLTLVQHYVNGVWTGGVQNFMCLAPSAPGPVRLDPGASIDEIRVFEPGRYRLTASVATRGDLSNSVTALSNAFDAP
jgi:hypothetical protein